MGSSTAVSADAAATDGASSTTAPEPPSESTSSTAEGHPMLVISDGPTHDFGSLDLTETIEHAFSISNEGEGDATSLLPAVEGAAFVITSHDCGEVLAAAASCEIEVSFQPNLFGGVGGELQLAYQDQGVATSVTRSLVGRGVGTTANLLVNGGGELGDADDIPPMGWTIGYGPSWAVDSILVPPAEGTRTIFAGWGPPMGDAFSLFQSIDVTSLTTWDDAAGVRFHYRAFHRAEASNDDPSWVLLRFLDAGGGEIGTHPSSLFSGATWNQSTGDLLAPAGTHHVELALECNRALGDACSGFFDGVELWAEWSG